MTQENKNTEDEEDYIFHFELNDDNKEQKLYDNPLIEMIRQQINNLLEIVVLTKDGVEIEIDGFKLICNKETNYPLY